MCSLLVLRFTTRVSTLDCALCAMFLQSLQMMLTDLLKQQGSEASLVENATAGSPSGGRANGRMLRSRSEQYQLNNAAYGAFGQGLPQPHSNHSTLGLNKYASLKAV
ncbi:hypothetical protein AMECASPLE_019843, partial [Ameca splendens]